MSDATDLPETIEESFPEVVPVFVPPVIPPLVVTVIPTPLVEGVPSVVPGMSMTPLAFIGRIAAEEQKAISEAAITIPAVWLLMYLLGAAQEVLLDDPRTVGGVEAMVAAGILTPARAAEILRPSTTND